MVVKIQPVVFWVMIPSNLNKFDQAVMLLCIWKVPSSNLGQDTDYPN
jgi:hypothetical protein